MEKPTSTNIDMESIVNRLNELESKIKELEKKSIKLERFKTNLVPKTTLEKQFLFEKDICVSDNVIGVIIGINFTNTNHELIRKSYNCGVPVIIGNSSFYHNNKYLNEHLVVKSDDDINEIVDKIKFVQNNYKKILEEYNKNII